MLTKINPTTWKEVAKDDPKDRIEVIIGDDKQPDFKPQVKLERWDNEVNFSIRLKDSEVGTEKVSTLENKIIWEKGNIKASFYELTEGEGGYEFEIILKEKPLTNKIEFTLNTKGLDFFYQPELTQKEKDEGCIRPENVIGSYAVYCSEQKINRTNGKLYRTGKAGHIFRPKITDTGGKWAWEELNIKDGVLTITIPQDFLDRAVYPISSKGTQFGYTTFGSTNGGIIGQGGSTIRSGMQGRAFSLLEAGTLDSISVGVKLTLGATTPQTLDLYAAIFDEDSAGSGSHDLIASVEQLEASVSNIQNTFITINAANENLPADTYILAVLGNGEDLDADHVVRSMYDTTVNGNIYFESTSGVGGYTTRKAEDPWTETASISTSTYSIYATYTPVGGVTHEGSATLSGVGTLAGIGALILRGIASLSGTGLLSAKGVRTFVASAILSGAGLLSGVGRLVLIGKATLSGVGSLICDGIIAGISRFVRKISPYFKKTGLFTRKSGVFTKKSAVFTRKASLYSKQITCPFILQENGWPLLQENRGKIRL